MCQCKCSTQKSIYQPEMATVKKTELMNETEMYLQIAMDEKPLGYKPGQFVEVSVAGMGEAPISISSSPTQEGGFELVVRKIGNVTNKIHEMTEGSKVGIRGPLGLGCYPTDEVKGKNLVFICGGIGLVPQRSFINYVLDNRKDYGDVIVLQGTRDPSQRFYKEELADWQKRDDITLLETVDQADDSWDGNVGVVTTLIPKIETDLENTVFFICGPPIMYKFVLLALAEKKISKDNIFLNLERKMKCGVGKCGHCQMNKYYVCVDGPVFRFSELDVAPEAI